MAKQRVLSRRCEGSLQSTCIPPPAMHSVTHPGVPPSTRCSSGRTQPQISPLTPRATKLHQPSTRSQVCWRRNSRGHPSTPPPLPGSERRCAAGASHSPVFFECGAPTERSWCRAQPAQSSLPSSCPSVCLPALLQHRTSAAEITRKQFARFPPSTPSKSGAALRTDGGADKKNTKKQKTTATVFTPGSFSGFIRYSQA